MVKGDEKLYKEIKNRKIIMANYGDKNYKLVLKNIGKKDENFAISLTWLSSKFK